MVALSDRVQVVNDWAEYCLKLDVKSTDDEDSEKLAWQFFVHLIDKD
jgi:hypothetical protein